VFGVREVQNHLRLARRVDETGAGEPGAKEPARNGYGSAYGASPEART
jgi:hypothetical protein